MRKEDFYYDSRDGEHKIHAVRYTPEDGKIVGVLQILHGMSEYAERYEPTAEYFVKQGYVVVANDHLGHGLSVGEDKRYGYFCEQDPATVVVRDAHRLKKMTQKLYPRVPYYIMGHSMGSFILRNYLFRYGTGIDGAVIVGTGMQSGAMVAVAKAMVAIQKFFFGSKHVSGVLSAATFGSYNKRCKPVRTPVDWLSRNTENVDRYIADELCGFVFTVNGFGVLAELSDRMRRRENLAKIPGTLPILLVAGEEDPVGNYGAGVKSVYESMKEMGLEDVTMKLYEGCRHEILNEDAQDQVRLDILNWLKDRQRDE